MEQPEVRKGEWIRLGSGINGYVFDVYSDGTLSVGYYQNNSKAIKEDVVWLNESWNFKHQGPDGTYLSGHEAAIVKSGPVD